MADADTGSKPVDQKTLMADIDRTRAELARTIDAISDRVSPRRNVERATGQLRERASQIEGQLRERASQIDPIVVGAAVAAATVVVGVTVLLLMRRRRR
jgi:anti-sigma factor RsiW